MGAPDGFSWTEDPLSAPVFTAAPDGSPAAVCAGVGKTYRTATEPVRALVDVTLSIPRGQVTVVVGPSGSGKSSLLRLLACIDSPDTGEVFIAGRRVDRLRPRARRRLRRQQVAYLFQRPGENLLPYLDAVGQIRLAGQLRGVRGVDAGEQPQQRGLPRPGRPDHDRHLRPGDGQGDVDQRRDRLRRRPVGLAHTPADRRRRGGWGHAEHGVGQRVVGEPEPLGARHRRAA